jgi:flagellum-specific peptidoglycan hydrolase FlgJ
MPPSAFIGMMLPLAQDCQHKYGIPASVTIAQAAIETGWGERVKANNLFGIKADRSWKGPTITFGTTEYLGADKKKVSMPDVFRAYGSWAESVADRAKFLKDNPRYAKCFQQTTPEGWAREIAAGGWATGPDYAELMCEVMHGRKMEQYDVPRIAT